MGLFVPFERLFSPKLSNYQVSSIVFSIFNIFHVILRQRLSFHPVHSTGLLPNFNEMRQVRELLESLFVHIQGYCHLPIKATSIAAVLIIINTGMIVPKYPICTRFLIDPETTNSQQ